MSMMTPISSKTPALDRAERLSACRTIVVEMLAEAARALDLADAAPPSVRSGPQLQFRLRMLSASMLLDEIDDIASDDIRATAMQIRSNTVGLDSDAIRDISARLDAAFDIELHSIKIGTLWDRYEI